MTLFNLPSYTIITAKQFVLVLEKGSVVLAIIFDMIYRVLV